jgi:hypothetical protein
MQMKRFAARLQDFFFQIPTAEWTSKAPFHEIGNVTPLMNLHTNPPTNTFSGMGRDTFNKWMLPWTEQWTIVPLLSSVLALPST